MQTRTMKIPEKLFIGLFFIYLIVGIPLIFAQTENVNLITKSSAMQNVIFDGKWTFPTEWKISSVQIINYDDNAKIYLRTAHYEDFIYVMVNFASDEHVDKNMDKATICFDADNQGSSKMTKNDYCFTVTLGDKQGNTFQGGTDFVNNGYMKKIDNFEGFIAIAESSDENDRYNKNSHATYEFRIPIDAIGRSVTYGFFLSVFEANSNKFYTWPKDLRDDTFEIPPPDKWALILSPDKSIPEFPLAPFVMIIPMIMIIVISRIKINFFK